MIWSPGCASSNTFSTLKKFLALFVKSMQTVNSSAMFIVIPRPSLQIQRNGAVSVIRNTFIHFSYIFDRSGFK